MAHTPRFYTTADISDQETVLLDQKQTHQIAHVMRMDKGEELIVFNEKSGEWRGEIIEISRRETTVKPLEKTRDNQQSSGLTVICAALKKQAFDFAVEKAAELGADRFIPVATTQSVVSHVNREKMEIRAIEAAQQCGAIKPMAVADQLPLFQLHSVIATDTPLYVCDAQDKTTPHLFNAIKEQQGDKVTLSAVLIGPEGGLVEEDYQALTQFSQLIRVSLGQTILRAETAVAAATTIWQTAVRS